MYRPIHYFILLSFNNKGICNFEISISFIYIYILIVLIYTVWMCMTPCQSEVSSLSQPSHEYIALSANTMRNSTNFITDTVDAILKELSATDVVHISGKSY